MSATEPSASPPVAGVDQDQEQEREADSDDEPFLVDTRWTVVGGAMAGIFGLVAMVAVGQVSNYEAGQLLQASLPTVRFLASSAMAAAATILALMLTLLGLSHDADEQFRRQHYRRIKLISTMSSVTIVASILVLMLLVVPVEESEQLTQWYDWIYYFILASSALVGALLTTVVLMLLNAIRGMVQFVGGGDSPLVADP